MTTPLLIKMSLFSFLLYTLNVNQERPLGMLFFIGVTSKLIIIVVMICGKIINPWVIIVMGIFSKLISDFIVFSSLYVKRYMTVSSLGVMGWLSARVGVCHLTDDC